MEWRKCYLDVILVPLGFIICMGYHIWLWHKVKTQPLSTIIGTNSNGRRLWVSAIMKVINYLNKLLLLLLSYLGAYNMIPSLSKNH